MIYRGACQKIYSRIAPVVMTAAAFAIAAERAKVFAQAMESDSPTFPLGETEQRKNSGFKTKEEACKQFEGELVTYYDQASLIENCKQRNIESVEILNALTKLPGKRINEVPASVYRLIPFGSPFTQKDFDELTKKKAAVGSPCANLPSSYLTATSVTYYFIENCKKRPFKDYFSLESHNKNKKPVATVSDEVLDRIPTGEEIAITKGEYSVLYKIDGDSNWSKLYRARNQIESQPDSAESLAKAEEDAQSVDKASLCKTLNHKVVSYYTQVFFVEDCKIRPIKDFATSIIFQQKVDEAGGVLDVSPYQKQVLVEGKEISVSEALKKLR